MRTILIGRHLSRMLARDKITHIHAHFGFIATDVASHVSRVSGIPFSCSLHARDIYANNEVALKAKLKNATFIITCTEYNKEYLVRQLGTEWRKKICVIYHGTVLEDWVNSKGTRDIVFGHSLKVVTVGRLVEKKGFNYLLDAVKILKDQGMLIECDVIGHGPLRKQLQLSAQKLGIADRVNFKGHLLPAEIRTQLMGADIFVLPCIIADDGDRDGIPNVLMEAMAMEVPVISSNISAIPELVKHGINGLILQPKDSFAVARAISQLYQDKHLYLTIKSNSRKSLVEKFNSRENNSQLLRMFQCVHGNA